MSDQEKQLFVGYDYNQNAVTDLGFLELTARQSAPESYVNGLRLFANLAKLLSWRGADGYVRALGGNLSADPDRTYQHCLLPIPSTEKELVFISMSWKEVV